MKHALTKLIVALVLIALLGARPVLAVERPFKLIGAGDLTPITDEAGNVIGGMLAAVGTATHLGMWTQTGTLTFSPHPSDPTLILADGDSIITAANGDELHVTITGAVLDTNTGIATGSFDFAGGTGRFANASGSAPFEVLQDFDSGTFGVVANGMIDY